MDLVIFQEIPFQSILQIKTSCWLYGAGSSVLAVINTNFHIHLYVANLVNGWYKILGLLRQFLNQARAGRRPARAWFLEIAFVRGVSMRVCVCVCGCVSAPEALNN